MEGGVGRAEILKIIVLIKCIYTCTWDSFNATCGAFAT